ncbi:PP2C family protein-serine/threonine phosphatase [Amycolatopsis sp. NPDC089917]|uniref:PP2C family protein-serine/threonine phosphatase n=1 Tax=Amycolatopsis sp. NPDC089917 TaxID=3155187 RepID=UPI00343D7A0E
MPGTRTPGWRRPTPPRRSGSTSRLKAETKDIAGGDKDKAAETEEVETKQLPQTTTPAPAAPAPFHKFDDTDLVALRVLSAVRSMLGDDVGVIRDDNVPAHPVRPAGWSRDLLDNAPYGVLVMRRRGEPKPGEPADFLCVYANEAVALHTGMTDPAGDTVGERLSRDQAVSWNAVYEEVWRTGITTRRVQSLEQTDRQLEIAAFALESTGTDLVDGGGPERLVAMMLTDVTPRTRRDLDRDRDQRRTAAIALALQHAMLGPTHSLPDNIAVRYRPAHDETSPLTDIDPVLLVGGDFHDVVPLPGDRCALVVGDVVGKGLHAATVMGQIRSAARALLLENRGPAHTLTALDRFATELTGALCTTMFCAIVHLRTGHLDYASAGHPPPLLSTSPGQDHSRLSDALSPPLGVPSKHGRDQTSLLLTDDTLLLLYTDGLVEARGHLIDDGINRIGTTLTANHDEDLDAIADSLLAARADPDLPDDTALLLYRHRH